VRQQRSRKIRSRNPTSGSGTKLNEFSLHIILSSCIEAVHSMAIVVIDREIREFVADGNVITIHPVVELLRVIVADRN
jgi:hypothetical protein